MAAPSRRLLTFSKLSIAEQCQYFLRSDVQWLDQGGYYARIGTGLHALAEATTKGQPIEPILEKLRAKLDQSDMADVEAMYAHWLAWWETLKANEMDTCSVVSAEVAVRYNPTTGVATQILGRHKRDYADADPDTEIAGTSDLTILSQPGEPEPDAETGLRQHLVTQPWLDVLDYKTGHLAVPPNSPQMLGLGLATKALYGNEPKVRLRIVTVHEDGVYESQHTPTDEELEATSVSIQQILATDLAETTPNPGPHCQWCPARDACPATRAAIAGVETTLGLQPKLSLTIRDNDHAAAIVRQLTAAQGFLESVEKAVKHYADENGGINMGEGMTWAAGPATTETPKLTLKAIEQLRALGLGAALKTTTTWKDLVRVGGPEKAKKAREALRELGAVGKFTFKRYQLRKATKTNNNE